MLTLLRNVEIYAPEPRDARHILVGGGKVLWMGRDLPSLPASLGVVERDFGGRRVIPGLVDGHVHLTGGGGESGPESRVPPVPLTRFTRGGVTTVVGVLGTDDVTRTTAVARRRGAGARGGGTRAPGATPAATTCRRPR